MEMIRMVRLSRRPLLLGLFFFASLLLIGGRTAPAKVAAQDDPTHLGTVQAAYNLLLDHFYRVPDPVSLLDDAWDGATRALVVAGLPGRRPAAPDLPPDRVGAWQAFAAAYRDLLSRAPASITPTPRAARTTASKASN